MRYLLVILLFMVIYPTFAQAGAGIDGHSPRQRRVEQQRPNRQLKAGQPMKLGERIKRVQEVREAYVVAKVNLSPDQKEKFIPVFRQYANELLEAQNERKLARLNPQGTGLEQLQRQDDIDQKIRTIRQHYTQEFLKIMPPEKVALIYRSEQEFHDEAFEKLKGQREDTSN